MNRPYEVQVQFFKDGRVSAEVELNFETEAEMNAFMELLDKSSPDKYEYTWKKKS